VKMLASHRKLACQGVPCPNLGGPTNWIMLPHSPEIVRNREYDLRNGYSQGDRTGYALQFGSSADKKSILGSWQRHPETIA
jgi:hypothetical protein